MQQELSITTNEFANELAELFVTCKTASEYCRQIVLHKHIGRGVLGSQLFSVAQDGTLLPIASFGKIAFPASQRISIWDANVVAMSVRENQETSAEVTNPETGEKYWVFAYPYRNPDTPIGVVVGIREKNESVVLDPAIQQTLSRMGALWMEALGLGSEKVTATFEPESLTPRQLEILQQMANGKTNAQIASEMILSESSIRQETVKIYKALGVSSRQEASKRAINQGLIQRTAS